MNKSIKRILCILCVLTLFAGAGLTEAVPKTELIVFAAASMTETLTRLKDVYEAEHPGVICRSGTGHGRRCTSGSWSGKEAG